MLIKGLSAAFVAATLLAPVAIAGPVDVNTADAKTLARELQGVGMAKAEAIVSYREKNGPFKSADDLAKEQGQPEVRVGEGERLRVCGAGRLAAAPVS
jgi:competence protein ComEA